MRRRGILALGLFAGLHAAAVNASVLCKARHGGLLVRDECKSREELLDAPALGELGLRGPAGPVGPIGPAGGGLKVLDVNAAEVGVVIALRSYYGQFADVVRQMSLPGGSGQEFVLFSVTPQGVQTSPYACNSYYGTFFRTADCRGQEFQRCDVDGSCSSVDGAFLYTKLTSTNDGLACFTRGGAEFERGTFYRENEVSGPSILNATQQCDAQGGALTAPPVPCPGAPLVFCGQCCVAQSDVGVAPLHKVNLSGVGTPPFRLGR